MNTQKLNSKLSMINFLPMPTCLPKIYRRQRLWQAGLIMTLLLHTAGYAQQQQDYLLNGIPCYQYTTRDYGGFSQN